VLVYLLARNLKPRTGNYSGRGSHNHRLAIPMTA
jgi:hypothetical protein